MYPWFMESIWWVFKELYNKGLVYKGFKVNMFILSQYYQQMCLSVLKCDVKTGNELYYILF